MFKKLLYLFGALPCALYSQIDLGTPIATGKGGAATAITHDWQCIGINPANLGYSDNYKFSLGLLNVGFSAQSKALDMTTIYNAALHPTNSFTSADKQKLAEQLSTADGLNIYGNVNWIAASLYVPKLGGFAFNVRDRVNGHATLSKNTADIIFNGANSIPYQDTSIYHQPVGYVLNGTHASYYHYREMNISYGRKIIGSEESIQLFGGIGFKYLWGIADMDFKADGNKIDGHASFSSNYGFNPTYIKNYTAQTTDNIFNTVGKGYAFDIGTGLKIKNNLTFAASITDMGAINWNKNNVIAMDTTMPKLDTSQTGISHWDANSLPGFLYNSVTNAVSLKGGSPYKTQLPTRLRLGIGLKIGKKILIGADAVMPMNNANGNLESTFFALGGEINLFGTAKLSTGVSGNKNYGFSIPMGFTLGTLGITEVYIATNDVLSYLGLSNHPQLSFAMAVLRINLKNPLVNEAK